MTEDDTSRKRKNCPYLDTIDRTALDFDLEHTCSVTLETGPHIYACLVCGLFFRGRGPKTPACTHALQEGHYLFCHLSERTFHCLPDNYEIHDPSLQDIRDALHPTYTPAKIRQLDQRNEMSRDLFGRLYLPGFIGLQNLQKTDCINAVVQALAHVRPLRDYFLLHADDHRNAATVAFGNAVRHLWSPHRFRSHLDPRQLVQAWDSPNDKRNVGACVAWLLHQLHVGTLQPARVGRGEEDTRKKKKRGPSIVEKVFQGKVRVTTRQARRKEQNDRTFAHDEDDRLGSGDEEDEGMEDTEDAFKDTKQVEESSVVTKFLQLNVEIMERPLFRDDDGGLVIPQEPLVTALQKFNGKNFVDAKSRTGAAQRKRYEILKLPDCLILHLDRFKEGEKNPTIVVFPVKNLDLAEYLVSDAKLPTEEQIRAMGVSELKALLQLHNNEKSKTPPIERGELTQAVVDAVSLKYDLVANISHESPSIVGREGAKVDPLKEGTYKCHVKAQKQWYEIQDLHVNQVMPQQIGVTESCLLIFERRATSTSST